MDEHAEREHARFSPSQAERFFACHGSINLLARVPKSRPSEYAIEGTKAHIVLDAALKNGVRNAKEAHLDYSSLCMEDLDTPENFFYRAIQAALNYIYAILDDYPDAILYTERRVDPIITSAPGEAAGYCDIAIHIPSLRTLYIVDYKHGAGISKEAKGNPQPMQYAAGFLYEDNAVVDPQQISSVVLAIVQPRAFHRDGIIREHEATPYEIYEYLQELDEVIEKCLEPDAELVSDDDGRTTDHCRFCDANYMCPAREARAVAATGTQFRTVREVDLNKLPEVKTMDVDRLTYIRQAAPILRAFLNDVDAQVKSLLYSGYNVNGSKLVEAQARREWYGDPQELAQKAAALACVPVDEVMEYRMLPITTVEKLIVEAFKARVGRGHKTGAAADARKAMAFLTLKKSSGNLVLVYDDDERPAVNAAGSAFKQIAAAIEQKDEET